MEGNASVYQVNPVSRITGEGRAEFLRTWGGAGFDQKGGGRGERGEQVGQLNLCVETINPSCGGVGGGVYLSFLNNIYCCGSVLYKRG